MNWSEFGVNICVIHSFWSDLRDHSESLSDPCSHSKMSEYTNVHSKFTLISLFSKIHSLKSEHIHSFLFREYTHFYCNEIVIRIILKGERDIYSLFWLILLSMLYQFLNQ